MPARATAALATGLSKAARHACGREPTYGSPTSSRTSRTAPSSPVSPCSSGSTQSGRSSRRNRSRSASTSRTSTSVPVSRRASATRLPDRSETSRSWERPPASTTTRQPPLFALVVRTGSPCRARSGQVGVRRLVPTGALVRSPRGEPGAERLPELQLLLDHADQATYPLPDSLGGRIAVRQPHALRSEAVGEERGAGHERHS